MPLTAHPHGIGSTELTASDGTSRIPRKVQGRTPPRRSPFLHNHLEEAGGQAALVPRLSPAWATGESQTDAHDGDADGAGAAGGGTDAGAAAGWAAAAASTTHAPSFRSPSAHPLHHVASSHRPPAGVWTTAPHPRVLTGTLTERGVGGVWLRRCSASPCPRTAAKTCMTPPRASCRWAWRSTRCPRPHAPARPRRRPSPHRGDVTAMCPGVARCAACVASRWLAPGGAEIAINPRLKGRLSRWVARRIERATRTV